MQWLPLAFEFVMNVGMALGLDRISKLTPWWLRLAAIVVGLSMAFVFALGLVFVGAFMVGLVTAAVR